MFPDYEIIEEVSSNERHSLYRGRRGADGQPVLLKVTRRDSPAAADLELLEREFETLRALSVAGIPRAYELLRRADGGCAVVLEDRGGLPLPTLFAARRPDAGAFLDLAIRLSAIL